MPELDLLEKHFWRTILILGAAYVLCGILTVAGIATVVFAVWKVMF